MNRFPQCMLMHFLLVLQGTTFLIVLQQCQSSLVLYCNAGTSSLEHINCSVSTMNFNVTGRMLGSIKSALQNSRSARGYEKPSIVSPINGTKCCHEPQRPWLAYRLFQLMTIMLLASTTILVILYSMTFKSLADCRKFTNTNNGLLTCGESVAEAKGMGRDFDLLAKAWLPAACPRHGLADFTTSVRTALMGIGDPNGNDNGDKSEVNQWRYYSAKHNGRGISIDELAAMADHLYNDTQYWTTRREHSVHCA